MGGEQRAQPAAASPAPQEQWIKDWESSVVANASSSSVDRHGIQTVSASSAPQKVALAPTAQPAPYRPFVNSKPASVDLPETLKPIEALALNGDAEAQYQLGCVCDNGLDGVPPDCTAAARWYEMAAEQGHAKAQVGLGGLYASGLGVTQNYQNAHLWFTRAISGGDQNASNLRRELEKKMTTDQIAQAFVMAKFTPLKRS